MDDVEKELIGNFLERQQMYEYFISVQYEYFRTVDLKRSNLVLHSSVKATGMPLTVREQSPREHRPRKSWMSLFEIQYRLCLTDLAHSVHLMSAS